MEDLIKKAVEAIQKQFPSKSYKPPVSSDNIDYQSYCEFYDQAIENSRSPEK